MQIFTIVAALSALASTGYATPHHSKPAKDNHSKPAKDTCRDSSTTGVASSTSMSHSATATGPSTSPTSGTHIPTPPPSSMATSSSATSTSSCSQYTSLPASFYIEAPSAYLAAIPSGNGTAVLTEVSTQAEATTFSVYSPENSTVQYLNGEPLLAFSQTNPATGKTVTYSAWIQGLGSAIKFYNVDISTDTLLDSGHFAVSANNGFESCNFVPGAILEHDSSDVSDCDGTIWLYGGVPSGCTEISLTFSPA